MLCLNCCQYRACALLLDPIFVVALRTSSASSPSSVSADSNSLELPEDPSVARLHAANMKALVFGWDAGKFLGLEFECDMPAPRLPHAAQVRLSASLKAAYGNQLAQAQMAT